HATDLLGGDEPRLLQDTDVLLHAREGHVELHSKVCDRSVCTPELLQNAASGGVRERAERAIEAGFGILNHSVQYITNELTHAREDRARALPAAFPQSTPYLDADSIDSIPRPLGSSINQREVGLKTLARLADCLRTAAQRTQRARPSVRACCRGC